MFVIFDVHYAIVFDLNQEYEFWFDLKSSKNTTISSCYILANKEFCRYQYLSGKDAFHL